MLPVSSTWPSPGRARTATSSRPLCACSHVSDLAFRQCSRRPLQPVSTGQRFRSMPVGPHPKQVTAVLISSGFSRVRAVYQAAMIRAQHHVLHHEVPGRQQTRVAARCVHCVQVRPVVQSQPGRPARCLPSRIAAHSRRCLAVSRPECPASSRPCGLARSSHPPSRMQTDAASAPGSFRGASPWLGWRRKAIDRPSGDQTVAAYRSWSMGRDKAAVVPPTCRCRRSCDRPGPDTKRAAFRPATRPARRPFRDQRKDAAPCRWHRFHPGSGAVQICPSFT